MNIQNITKNRHKFANTIEEYLILKTISSTKDKSSMKVRLKQTKVSSSSIALNNIVNEVFFLKKIKLTDTNKILLFSQIEILKKLDHSHIIKLYHIFYQYDCVYLIFEYCNEGDLDKRLNDMNEKGVSIRRSKLSHQIDNSGQENTFQTNQNKEMEKENESKSLLSVRNFNENVILEFLIQIFSGLMYLHSKGIVHKNLNLKSILFKNGVIKISGFKFALENRHFQKTSSKIVFEAENLVGNPYFMAPELYKYSNFDYKVDVWSVGMLIVNMIYNRNPFEGKSLDEVKKNIQYETFYHDELDLILSNKVLINIVKACLEKDPSQRIVSKKAYVLIENEVISKNINVKYEMNSKKLSTNMNIIKMLGDSKVKEYDEIDENNKIVHRKENSIDINSKSIVLPLINSKLSGYNIKKMSNIDTKHSTINLSNMNNQNDRISFLSPTEIKKKASMSKSKYNDISDKEFDMKRLKFNQLVKVGYFVNKLK